MSHTTAADPFGILAMELISECQKALQDGVPGHALVLDMEGHRLTHVAARISRSDYSETSFLRAEKGIPLHRLLRWLLHVDPRSVIWNAVEPVEDQFGMSTRLTQLRFAEA